MAERKGFEPLKAVTPWRFSRPLVSTSSRIFPLARDISAALIYAGLEPAAFADMLIPNIMAEAIRFERMDLL